jgi:predicted AAA+ superfamily ATPase
MARWSLIDFVYIQRDLEQECMAAVRDFPAVAVSGPRQSGKSTMLQELFGRTHQLISFDNPAERDKFLDDPQLFINQMNDRVILDEIQYVPEITSYIKVLIDSERQRKGRFLLTGSQQFSLIKNLGDSLAGRVGLLYLLPFGIEEKSRIAAIREKFSTTIERFVHGCLVGSYPEIATDPSMNRERWYGAYLQTYLERDVRSLSNIGDLRDFQHFIRLLAARCGQILNYSSISRELGISVPTVKRWISILEASQIIFLLPPYYRNLGKRITRSPKLYFLDVGLACYLTGLHTEEHLLKGPMAGALFENFVILEIVKAYFNHGRRPDIFFIRTHNGLEIDLLMERALELYPIEIRLTQTPRIGMVRPIERFRKLLPRVTIHEGRFVTLVDGDEYRLTENVRLCDLESFLNTIPL